MKKSSIIGLIIVLVLILLVISISIFGMVSIINKTKTPIDAQKFKVTLQDKGYNLVDSTMQFAKYKNYIKKSYLAKKAGYQIEFYEVSTKENAKSLYNINKEKFESQKIKGATSTSVKMKNYSKFELNTNGKYRCLSLIDNTLVYIDVNEQYKDEVKIIMNEIGY